MSFRAKVFSEKVIQLWNKGAFHIFIGSFLTKFVAFFGSIFLVRELSKTSFGLLVYIENIYSFIYIIAGLGLGNAILRYVILGKTKEEKFGYYRYAVIRGTIFNLFLVILASLVLIFYPHPEEFKEVKWLILIILIALPFQFLVESNILTYRALLLNKTFAVTSFILSTLLIFSKYIGAVYFDLNGVLASIIIINLLFALGLSFLTYQKYFKGIEHYRLRKSEKKTINNFSIQYMITNGIWVMFMLIDVFLLGWFIGDTSVVADYRVAYVLPANLSIISISIGIFIGPYFVKNEFDSIWVWKNYKRTLFLITCIIAPLALILIFFAKFIINILFGYQYENIVPLMQLLTISSFVNCTLRYTSAHLLSSMGQIKYNMVISIIGVFLLIGINCILIPAYGAVGAAITSILVYSLMALALFIVFLKKYKFNSKL